MVGEIQITVCIIKPPIAPHKKIAPKTKDSVGFVSKRQDIRLRKPQEYMGTAKLANITDHVNLIDESSPIYYQKAFVLLI